MGSRTATWLAWSMCLAASAAIAGTLAVDVVTSSLDAFTILGLPPILAFSVVGQAEPRQTLRDFLAF
jgi:hypothetical protein